MSRFILALISASLIIGSAHADRQRYHDREGCIRVERNNCWRVHRGNDLALQACQTQVTGFCLARFPQSHGFGNTHVSPGPAPSQPRFRTQGNFKAPSSVNRRYR